MTTMLDERLERAALMGRLRALVSLQLANDFSNAPIDHLRAAVQSCEDQLAFYHRIGLKDASVAE